MLFQKIDRTWQGWDGEFIRGLACVVNETILQKMGMLSRKLDQKEA